MKLSWVEEVGPGWTQPSYLVQQGLGYWAVGLSLPTVFNDLANVHTHFKQLRPTLILASTPLCALVSTHPRLFQQPRLETTPFYRCPRRHQPHHTLCVWDKRATHSPSLVIIPLLFRIMSKSWIKNKNKCAIFLFPNSLHFIKFSIDDKISKGKKKDWKKKIKGFVNKVFVIDNSK